MTLKVKKILKGSLTLFILTFTLINAELQNSPAIAPEILKEIEYADALKEMGLPDFSEKILQRIKDPAAQARVEAIKIENLAARGKFDEAKQIIASQPDQNSEAVWAMKLALVGYYYGFGKYDEAKKIYESFFNTYPAGPPIFLKNFYIDAARQYAQMLMYMNDKKGAVKACQYALKAIPKTEQNEELRNYRRQILTEAAEILVKLAEESPAGTKQQYIDEAMQYLNEIMWVQDLWFGKAVVMLAHIKLMNNDVEGAMRIINKFEDQLMQIDKALTKEAEESGTESLKSLSPMAQCRYLLGTMFYNKAISLLKQDSVSNRNQIEELLIGKVIDKIKDTRVPGALQHFVNVFFNYPDTPWALDAGRRAEEIKKILLETYNIKISWDAPPEKWQKVAMQQFRQAHVLYTEGKYDEAINAIINVISFFPETESSIIAIGELVECFVEKNEMIYADSVLGFLAERFCRNETLHAKAGDTLINLANYFKEKQLPEKQAQVEQLFVTKFTRHPRASLMLFTKAKEKTDEGDIRGAIENLKQLLENHKNSPVYEEALLRLAKYYSEAGDITNEIELLKSYIKERDKESSPGRNYLLAKLRLVTAKRKLEKESIQKIIKEYTEIESIFAQPEQLAKYQKTSEDTEANKKILQSVLFNKGICYMQLNDPPEKVDSYRKTAIEIFKNLLTKFPDTELAPQVLLQIGTAWTLLGNSTEAEKSLNELQQKFPDSPEAKNALFMLGMNLLNIGKRDEAIKIFKEMFKGGGKYTPSQILLAAEELLKNKEYEIALTAYEQLLSLSEKTPQIQERALFGKGKCLSELGQHEEAVKAWDTFLKFFPKSGFIIEASEAQSIAYSQLALKEPDSNKRLELFNKSIDSLNIARRYALAKKDEGLNARLLVKTGKVQITKGRAEEKFKTGDPNKYLREAVATFLALIFNANISIPEIKKWTEEAYNECIPLLLELKEWQDALDLCNEYKKKFPDGKYKLEVVQWERKAQINLITSSSTAEIKDKKTE